MARYLRFRVSLAGIDPEIWRLFLLREDATFEQLHEAIQSSFGWEFEHLFEFREKTGVIAGMRLDDDPEGDPPDAAQMKAASYFARRGRKCLYVYDFGDDWQHVVELVRAEEFPEKFERRLLGGDRAGPLEDCGGIYGYDECVRITRLSDAKIEQDEDAASRKEWMGDLDPAAFDLAAAQKKFDR